MTKQIKQIKSEFDERAIDVLKCVADGQTMRLEDAEGRTWTSESKSREGLAITIIKRDEEIVAKIVYDYETGEEKSFFC